MGGAYAERAGMTGFARAGYAARVTGWRQRSGVLASFGAALVLAGVARAEEGRVHPGAEAVQPLAPGRAVPSVRVRTVDGTPVDLAEAIRGHGALLVFYRGGW